MGSMRSLNKKPKPVLTEDEEGELYLDADRLRRITAKPLGLGKCGEPILFPVPLQTRVNESYLYDDAGKLIELTYVPEIVVGIAETIHVSKENCKTSKEAAIKALEASLVFFKKAAETAEADLKVLRGE
jgi:hypothetical protein